MTQEALYTLTPHGELRNRSETEIKSAIPESSTDWARPRRRAVKGISDDTRPRKSLAST